MTSEEAVQNQRPISVSAGRNLLRIIKNDLDETKANINLYVKDEKARVAKEIRGDLDQAGMDKAAEEAQHLRSEIHRMLISFQNQYPTLKFHGLPHASSSEIIRVSDNEISRRVKDAHAKIDSEADVALAIAEREFRKMERQVLKATVTAQAEEILAGIPTITELMAAAQQERSGQAREIS